MSHYTRCPDSLLEVLFPSRADSLLRGVLVFEVIIPIRSPFCPQGPNFLLEVEFGLTYPHSYFQVLHNGKLIFIDPLRILDPLCFVHNVDHLGNVDLNL